MISRRHVLSGVLASLAAPALAEAPLRSRRPAARPSTLFSAQNGSDSPNGAEALVSAAKLGGAVGFVVAETASGRVLEAYNGSLALPPASVAKTMTTFFALDRLGANFRFATRVIGTGPVQNGRLEGDLILVGGGDPSLDTDGLGDLAASLAARGIKAIMGRYLIYADGLPHIDQIDRDQPDHVGYNPALSGLNLNYNRVNFEWKRGKSGYEVGMDARGERFFPRVSMARMAVVDRAGPLFTYKSAQGGDSWTVSARALGKGGSRWLPVRHPERYTGEVFAVLMRAHGLRLPDPVMTSARPQGAVLAELRSDALGSVMRDMLRFSTNITAETIGLTASGATSLRLSGKAMSDWLAARHKVSAQFVDHSGLGGASRISPAEMVRALRAARAGGLPGLLREQGVQDENGKTIKNHPVRVIAKTGTLNFVSALAGYIQPPSGKELTFAMFSADVKRRDSLAMSQREQPDGGRQWTRRARTMQGQLIRRWAVLYT